MIELDGYSRPEPIHRGARSLVLRARRLGDGLPVVIKTPAARFPGAGDLRRLRNEFELGAQATRDFARDHVVQHLALMPLGSSAALVLQDFGGPLGQAQLEQPSLERFLELSLAITRSVRALHDASLLHLAVNPTNILINAAGDQVRLCDLSSAVRLESKSVASAPLESAAEYAAPERARRGEYHVDYRTDLYSLGVTLYELLTGRLPLSGEDTLGTIHLHLAAAPPSPAQFRRDVPPALSSLLIKLLAKNPDQRYQTASGLIADLERCRRELVSGTIPSFELGADDAPSQSLPAPKLYGREKHLAELLGVVDRVVAGENALVLIAGEPGVGKSALVGQLREKLRPRGCSIYTGKFERFWQEVPYSAFATAFRAFLQTVLTRSTPDVHAWRERIAEALGPNGQLLARQVPELERLVGPQAPVPALDPEREHARFLHLLLNLIDTIQSAERPLIVFLDDLQWADEASLSLVEQLLTIDGFQHMMLIATYRDTEVHGQHPVRALLRRLMATRSVVELKLRPLEESEVEQLVADCTSQSGARSQPLSRLVWQRTQGNPLFIGQYLRVLTEEHLLRFERSLGQWVWDLEACERQRATENLGDLLAHRLHRLRPSCQRALRYASCIGTEFDGATLATVLGCGSEEVQSTLAEAVTEELVLEVSGEASGLRSCFRFLHDHVQQAAYSLISEEERTPLHLTIGRLLLDAVPVAERETHLFQIVDHLARGQKLIVSRVERLDVAKLCLAAGRRAKAANAYEAARRYLQFGLDLQGADGWADSYDVSLALYREFAECSYLCGNLAAMEASCAEVIGHARTELDAIGAHELLIVAHIARSEMPSAIARARDVLRTLGVELPSRPSGSRVALGVGRTALGMLRETPESLLSRKPATDQRVLAAMRILTLITTPAYLTSPNLFVVIICRVLGLALEHGSAEGLADALLGWGAIQIATFGAVQRGYELASTAPRVIDKLFAAPRRGAVETNYNLLIRHWVEPLRSTIEPLRKARQSALEHGDLHNASVAAVTETFYMLVAGYPLAEVEEIAREREALLRRLGQQRFQRDAHRMLQLVRCLQGRTLRAQDLKGELVEEEKALKASLKGDDRAAIASLSYERALLLYIYADPLGALECCRTCAQYLDGVLATVYPPALDFLSAVVRGRLLGADVVALRRPRELREMRRSLRRLQRWAAVAPSNHCHRAHLVRAELARLSGLNARAMREYEQAIELAGQNGYVQEQAIALECAGRFYSGLGQERLAASTLLAARDAWLAWGATGKAAGLESEFSLLLSARTKQLDWGASPRLLVAGDTAAGVLDVASVLKAAQAILSEIRLPHLVRRLLNLAIENTGAQRGFLLLSRDGKLWLEAAADIDDAQKFGSQASVRIAADAGDVLPITIVEYVARALEPVLRADVSADPLFAADPYVRRERPLSVLCAPLISQGTMQGIVYLENNRMRGAFTTDRVELLRVLSTQAAIALTNSRLYGDLASAHELQLRLSQAQARFVPSEFLRSLDRESILDVALGDNTRKEMTVVFSDIRGFTSLLEDMPPQQHIEFINDYLGRMEPPILENGGFVDSYLGDAIMALFENEPDAAVRAAVRMSAELARFNQTRREAGIATIGMGVGISSGWITLGTIGGPMRIKCGVIGDPVNVAARVESLTKHFRCFLLITHHTRERLRAPEAFTFRMVDRAKVKGKNTPISLFEVLDAEPPARAAAKLRTLPTFEQAMSAYVGGDFADAQQLFSECLRLCPDDGAAALLEKRCHHLEAHPPAAWDGIEIFTEK